MCFVKFLLKKAMLAMPIEFFIQQDFAIKKVRCLDTILIQIVIYLKTVIRLKIVICLE